MPEEPKKRTPEEIMADYHARGHRLAELLAAHCREAEALCASYTTEDPTAKGGPEDGKIEYLVVIVRQYPFPTNPYATHSNTTPPPSN